MASCYIGFSFKQIFFFIYVLAVLTCLVLSLTHDEECLSLFQFKQNIHHQGLQKFNSWRMITGNTSNNGSDCCLWDGVVCSSKVRVIELDLSESFLSGRINSNSTIFSLAHLQKLNLSMNDFAESRIPFEVARLKQLRSLDLSNSNLSGQIPIEISHMVQLSLLDLSWNPLELQNLSLGNLLKNLTSLEELRLSGVEIGSSVPRFLANFSSLKSLQLRSCGLQDDFPSSIFHLLKLKLLVVSENPNLSGSLPEFYNNTLLEHLDVHSTGFFGIIPESVSKLHHVVILNLRQCYFSGSIPGSLSNLTQLTKLYLGENELTGLVPSLESLSKLILLQLSENDFQKENSYNWIGKLTNLNMLHLDNMNIYQEILPSFANLTKLSLLAMGGNFVFGHIPSSFMNLTQLSLIDLQQNQLQGPLSSSFSNFKSLELLNLRSNNFSGKLDLDTFVRLKKLDTLYLSGLSVVTTNNYSDGTLPEMKYLGLSSCNLKEFPPFLRFQTNMIGLFLDDNKIEGLVPGWIWNNSQETLEMIDLSYNFVTGFHQNHHFLPWVRLGVFNIMHNQLQGRLPIPPRTTVYYDVSYNNLIGEIPSSICEAKSLQLLDLSFNNMTGTLPPCLGNLSNSLSVLNLKRNNFYGTMMNHFTYGSLLKRIDLSENQFTGQLSKSLTNCTNLVVLSLGDNSFVDVFPFWLGSLTELKVLILRSNKLYGEIQGPTNNKSQFSKLQIIDLSNNGFSGQLPEKYFQSWNAMKSISIGKLFAINLDMDFTGFTKSYEYSITLTNKGVKTEYERILSIFIAIDLSCNNFEGQIPQEFQNLQGLQSLNLSNNHFTGGVLRSLRNLTNLESLDLSQNELSGEIPQELLQLGFLAILNVSFNRLDGPIPQGKQFYTFQNNSYMGNPGLCGQPLSKECQNSKAPTLPPTTNEPDSKSLFPRDIIDWIIIFSGVVSGFVIGIVFGNSQSSRYSDWFIERLGVRKDRWIRPLRNTRRNTSTN